MSYRRRSLDYGENPWPGDFIEDQSAKGIISQMDHIYADVYSEAELRAMKNFFSSPEGQSMLAKQPQAMAHVMPLVQQMQRDLMPKLKQMTEQFEAEMKASKTAKPAEAPAAPAKST